MTDTPKSPDAPREWWIEMAEQPGDEFEIDIVPVLWTFDPGPPFNQKLNHVIEKSAYDAVVKERDELKLSGRKINPVILERDKLQAEVEQRKQLNSLNVGRIQELEAQLAEAKEAIAGWGVDAQATREQLAEANAHVEDAIRKAAHSVRLEREVELLRRYGNKDCIAMADEAIAAGAVKEKCGLILKGGGE